MKKSEVAKKQRKNGFISEKEYDEIKRKVFLEIANTLKNGGKVKIRDFGTFSVNEHKARNGVNPKTGARIRIPSKKAIKLSLSKKLKRAVQDSRSSKVSY